MLVDQPRRGERGGADLLPRGLCGFEGRSDDDQSAVLGIEGITCDGERRRLAGAGSAFDDEDTGVAGQGYHHLALLGVELLGAPDADCRLDRPSGTRCDGVDQLRLDREHTLGGQVPDVVRYVGALAQRTTSANGTLGEVLGELGARGSFCDHPERRDELLDLAAGRRIQELRRRVSCRAG